MKTKTPFLLAALFAVLNLLPAGRVTAQTFATLHSFTFDGDGAFPYAGLITNSSGNTLYGTASQGGSSGYGTVFAVNTDGTGFTTLYSFTEPLSPPHNTNSDGAFPVAGLILSGSTLYGTANGGGSSGNGTVFAISTDGTGFMTLHSFTAGADSQYTNSDGAFPVAGLILSGNTLYGTASQGGSSGNGAVFAVHTDGTGFMTLHSFTAGADNFYGRYTNSDGANPYAGLILSGNTLYGTARQGGSSGYGTVFAVNTDGTGFTNLHIFTDGTNSDGANPYGGLILSGNTLYGTTLVGGSPGYGTVFAISTDGRGFTNLHNFAYTDGSGPQSGLIVSGNTLYGTTIEGRRPHSGTVFAVNTDGTGFTNLHRFTGYPPATDGAHPYAGLILSGNTLYGTARDGGSSGNGTVFSISFRPQLTITPSGTNVILSWPTNVAGFDYTGYTLQSTTNLLSTSAWLTNSPAPVVIAGQNTVTNPVSGARQFYRLVH